MSAKVFILASAALSSFYCFFHYGIMPAHYKSYLFFIMEILRLILFYLLCFYYTDRASGILKKRKVSKNVLSTVLASGLILISTFGIYIAVQIDRYYNSGKNSDIGIKPGGLCNNMIFRMFRYSHILLCIAFFLI